MEKLKQHYLELPNGTIHKLTLEGKIKSGTKIIYDGRRQSLQLLERYLSDNYYYIQVPERGSDFVVLERKENELMVKDDRLEAMKKQTTYFKNNEQKNEKNMLSSEQPSSQSAPENIA